MEKQQLLLNLGSVITGYFQLSEFHHSKEWNFWQHLPQTLKCLSLFVGATVAQR